MALIARNAKSLEEAANVINGYEGGEAAAFPISQYNKAEVSRVFQEIKAKWPGAEIRIAIYNTGHRIAKPFLELTQDDIGVFLIRLNQSFGLADVPHLVLILL